jgi:uncharacterized protein YqhQ
MSNSIDINKLELSNLQFKENKRYALNILYKRENLIRVVIFILYVFIPYSIYENIRKFFFLKKSKN